VATLAYPVAVTGVPDLVLARRASATAKAKQRLEGGPWLPAPADTEDELIEVDLELPAADSVMSTHQPVLEVADHPVGKGNNGLAAQPQPERGGCNREDMPVPAAVSPSKLVRPSV
jgi:hypothetical protein